MSGVNRSRRVLALAVVAVLLVGCSAVISGQAQAPPVCGATSSPAVVSAGATIVTVCRADGAVATDQQTAAALDLLTARLSRVPGAAVTAAGPGRVAVTVPASGKAPRELLAAPTFAARPVLATSVHSEQKSPAPISGLAVANPADPRQPARPEAAAWSAATTKAISANSTTCRDVRGVAALADVRDLPLLACDNEDTVYSTGPALLDAASTTQARAEVSPQSTRWVVSVTFSHAAASTWLTYTGAHVGQQVAFVVNGEVLTAPTIQGPINTSTTEISGEFTQKQAVQLSGTVELAILGVTFVVAPAASASSTHR